MEYLYSKEKDTLLEQYTKELSSMNTDEERIAFFKKLPEETRKELYFFMRWETEKARSEKLYLETKIEHLKEQRQQLLKEREEAITKEIDIAYSVLEACIKADMFNNIGES